MKTIADLIAYSVPDLTEEQWAARDAEIAKRDAEQAAEIERSKANTKRREFFRRGFTVRALEAAQTADESKPAIARVKAWDTNAESILVLSGPAGCGKTVAATWWAWNRASYVSFVRSTTFASSSRYNNETRDSWFAAPAFVLDDLGTEYADSKGNYQVDLDELVDVFYGDRKPLIITTNCTLGDFKNRYGSRIADRIRECGSWFSISSESLRRKL
jgi:DNA replication protein DnaC